MIHFDSRKVGEGDLFVAQRGVSADGHGYIGKAVAAGAVAVAVSPAAYLLITGALSLFALAIAPWASAAALRIALE